MGTRYDKLGPSTDPYDVERREMLAAEREALRPDVAHEHEPLPPEVRSTLARWTAERDAVQAPCPVCGHAAGAHDDIGHCRVTRCTHR